MQSFYHQFLCECLRCNSDGARALRNDARWNWERLFQAASQEMVLPALAGAVPDAPPDVSEFLSAVEFLSRDRNRAIFEELEIAAGLLNEIGIEPVLLKGVAYLATGVYRNPGRRYLMDLDLLVPEARLKDAAEILMQNGFAREDEDQFGRFRHHYPPLRRPGSVSIELHHSLGLGRCASLLPAREVTERAVLHDFNGVRVRIPCPEHLMTHLILHSQMQHPYNERIWPPLRAMYDLVLLQGRFSDSIDWKNIELRFRRARQYGMLALHLLEVRRALGLAAPMQLRLNRLTRLRWHRRKLLRRVPVLRYLDPVYMFSTVFIRRFRVLRNVVSTGEGWKHFVVQLCKPDVYQRLFTDVVEGRGR